MSEKFFSDGLATNWLGQELRSGDSVDSTNDRLWEWAREDAPHGALFVAKTQTGGRGRQGRRWESEEGNLFFSFLVRPTSVGPDLPALSLAAGLACARALKDDLALPAQLKWPNDLLIDGKKVGGILLETRRLPHPAVVVGIGLNLVDPSQGWGDLESSATSLHAHGVELSVEGALGVFLLQLERHVDQFIDRGFLSMAESFAEFDALCGKSIGWYADGEEREGIALGVDPRGALRVQIDDEELTLDAGEVHLRGSGA